MAAPRTAEILWQESRCLAERYARKIGSQDAADLAQQAVLKAIVQPDAERPAAYLEVVGRNLLADHWRHEACVRDAADELRRRTPDSGDPECNALRAERRQLVRRAIVEMPAELRRPLLLRFFFDLPYSALARRLGIGEITARTRVHRSLERLRSSLAPRLRALLVPFGWLKPAAVALVMVAHGALVTPADCSAGPERVAVAVVAPSHGRRTPAPSAVPAPAATEKRVSVRRSVRTRPTVQAAPEPVRGASEPQEPSPPVHVLQPDLTWVAGDPEASRGPSVRRSPRPTSLLAGPDLSTQLLETVSGL